MNAFLVIHVNFLKTKPPSRPDGKAVEIYRPKTNFKELMSNNDYIILIYKYISPRDFTTVCNGYVDIWLIMFIRALKV